MATDAPADLVLDPIDGEPRTVAEWLTTFHLVLVVVDPFTWESAWLLETAGRILTNFIGADCRVAWLATATEDEARQFLGPWAKQILTFTDPDREVVKALELQHLPALVHINQDLALAGVAEGWHADEWQAITDGLSDTMSWSGPVLPGVGDPGPFEGSEV